MLGHLDYRNHMRPEDELVNICVMQDDDDLMLFSDAGKAIRFAILK